MTLDSDSESSREVGLYEELQDIGGSKPGDFLPDRSTMERFGQEPISLRYAICLWRIEAVSRLSELETNISQGEYVGLTLALMDECGPP